MNIARRMAFTLFTLPRNRPYTMPPHTCCHTLLTAHLPLIAVCAFAFYTFTVPLPPSSMPALCTPCHANIACHYPSTWTGWVCWDLPATPPAPVPFYYACHPQRLPSATACPRHYLPRHSIHVLCQLPHPARALPPACPAYHTYLTRGLRVSGVTLLRLASCHATVHYLAFPRLYRTCWRRRVRTYRLPVGR